MTQRRGQQAVDAGPHRGLVRTLDTRGFVQQDVGLGVELPTHPLYLIGHAIGGRDVLVLVHQLQATGCVDLDQALLHQTRANAAGAKALGEEEV